MNNIISKRRVFIKLKHIQKNKKMVINFLRDKCGAFLWGGPGAIETWAAVHVVHARIRPGDSG